MQYKINVAIQVDYLAIDNRTGITDLYLTPTNPSGVDQTPILFTAIGDGLYKANFTPNANGWWYVKVTSATYPENIYAKSYYVGTSDDPYPTQEDGKITSVDTKFGEVQITPTTNTLLGRLKDIWDRLATFLTVKVYDTGGVNINPAKEDGNLSTRLADSTFTGRIGEVQATPTTNTVLGRLKDLYDKLVDLFTNGNGKVKIWDGTNQAGIDSANAFYVSGKSAVGIAPSSNPLYIAGIDAGGLKRGIKTNSAGVILTSGEIPSSYSLTINYDITLAIGGATVGSWIKALYYTIPANYKFFAIQFLCQSADNRMTARGSKFINLGTYNVGTHTFTDGSSYTLPVFANSLEAEVTTIIGGTNNIVLTITYTNQDNVTGRTGTISIPKNTAVGTKVPMTFQGTDYGVIDVTAVSRDTANTGIIQLDGTIELFYTSLPTANLTYIVPIAKDSIIALAGETIALDFSVNAASNVERIIKLIGLIVSA